MIEGSQLGFGNLAQTCAQIPRRRWEDAIREHFDRVLSTIGGSGDTDALDADFSAARPLLRVRLFPDDMAGLEKTVSRPIADGIISVLVYDFPESAAGVIRENIAGWDLPDDELFSIAAHNVRADEEIKPTRPPAQDGAAIFGVMGESIYTASRALVLRDYLPADLELGALVAIPNRHALLYHPILDEKAFGALQSLIPAAIGMYQQGPGSISPQVYWWQNGQFQRQPTEVTEEGIRFNPTEEFIFQVLNRIRPSSD